MININIKDGTGKGNTLKVGDEGEISTVQHPHPPSDEQLTAYPFRQYFTDSNGSIDMRVDGSVTNVEFTIEASAQVDIYVKTISIVIADAGASLGEWGNTNSPLTNGIEFKWKSQDIGEVIIADALKTNGDFVRLALGDPSIDVASNFTGASEAFLPVIDFTKTFGFPYGLRLRKGTTDKLVFTIKDANTTIDQMDAIAYGSQS